MEELLPAELMIDILSQLPVKAIFHCKCVCKKWRNLLLESSFIDLHLSRSPTTLIFHNQPNLDDPGILEWVEIDDKDDYHPLMSLRLDLAPTLQKSPIALKGSVNGLICLQIHDNTYICNPVTREYMIIPRQNYYIKSYETVLYGFGVSSMTGEYKVIRNFRRHNGDILEAEVYTLGTGQWRSLGRVPYRLRQSYDCHGSYLNGHCHWIVYDKENTLCSFEFDKETFQLFPSPPSLEEAIQDGEHPYDCLAILKGCLCKMDSYDFEFTIWVMKEYGIKESWHKEVVINQAISPHLDWPLPEPLKLIEGLKDGSILTVCDDKLWAFYPKNKTIEDTGLFESTMLVNGIAYRPSFLKLQNFEVERVNMF